MEDSNLLSAFEVLIKMEAASNLCERQSSRVNRMDGDPKWKTLRDKLCVKMDEIRDEILGKT